MWVLILDGVQHTGMSAGHKVLLPACSYDHLPVRIDGIPMHAAAESTARGEASNLQPEAVMRNDCSQPAQTRGADIPDISMGATRTLDASSRRRSPL